MALWENTNEAKQCFSTLVLTFPIILWYFVIIWNFRKICHFHPERLPYHRPAEYACWQQICAYSKPQHNAQKRKISTKKAFSYTFSVISHHFATFRENMKMLIVLFFDIFIKEFVTKLDQNFFLSLFHVFRPLFWPIGRIFRCVNLFPGGATRGFKAEFCAESI